MNKQQEFKRLAVLHEIGYEETTSEVAGFKRNGNVRYKKIYRTFMATESGKIELSEWKRLAKEVIKKYGEEDLFQMLLKIAVFPFMNSEYGY